MVINIGRNNKARGAIFERDMAKLFGGRRAGTKGVSDEEHEDIVIAGLRIQCKRRTRLSLSSEWWNKLERKAKEYHQVPIITVREDLGEPLALLKASHLKCILDESRKGKEESEWEDFLRSLSRV